ncbi:MAG: hypothetical protein R6V19_12580, partial [Armatimonadota bacterium]
STPRFRIPCSDFTWLWYHVLHYIDPDESRLLRINVVRNVVTKPREIGTWYPEPWGGAHADMVNQGWAILE